jgi:hypothetical protein
MTFALGISVRVNLGPESWWGCGIWWPVTLVSGGISAAIFPHSLWLSATGSSFSAHSITLPCLTTYW